MSKPTDNESFAKLVQGHLKAKGIYQGPIDGWAGPATQRDWRASVGLDPVPAPMILPEPPTIDGLPKPAASYRLPLETTAAMNAFYGAASRIPDYLDSFSFPYEGIRLYERDGVKIKDATGDGLPDHTCHKALIGRMTAALMEIYATLGREEFERQGWHLYGGCYNYRAKTGGSSLSTHSWGVAIDLNPSENYYAKTSTTFSAAAINIMEKWGFLSGFRAWGKDAMHFQAVIPNISAGSYYARNGLPKNIVKA